jgi:hypothetical protein
MKSRRAWSVILAVVALVGAMSHVGAAQEKLVLVQASDSISFL